MKVAILAPSPVPYTPGGAEAVWRGLQRELETWAGFEVELIKWPTREHSLPDLMSSYENFANVDLNHFDLVITGKYPAWMVEHPRHVVLMLHPLRGLYDTYASFGLPQNPPVSEPVVRRLIQLATSLRTRDQLPPLFRAWDEAVRALGAEHPDLAFPGPVARTLVHALDRLALAPGAVSRHLAISRTVARRPDYFPRGARVTAVHPPSDLQGLRSDRYEYFFTASRLDGPKRLDLLIRGMREYRGHVVLKIAGAGPELATLTALAAGDPRIEFLGRVSPTQLVDLYADALAVPFVPQDEDLGLITLEAMAASKPVLTCTDSGGPTELVVNEVNGLVVPPTPGAVGAGLTALSDAAYARRLGHAGARRARDVTWQRVVSAVVDAAPRPISSQARDRSARTRPKLVVVSTFALSPPRGGGQLRCVHLYGGLTEHYDVEAVCLGAVNAPRTTCELQPGFLEHVIPKSAAHEAAESAETAQVGIPITDIVAGRLARLTPLYGEALKAACQDATAVLLAHPFLYPEVKRVAPGLPVIYDAHNCEIVLKAALLPAGRHGDRLRATVRKVEVDAIAAARLIATVSEEDEAALRQSCPATAATFVQVPNGVDIASAPFVGGHQRRQNRQRYLARLHDAGLALETNRVAVFVGSWHMPNIEAGQFLLRLALDLPQVLFALVGGHCSALDAWPPPSNVVLLGEVGTATKGLLLRAADVALNPVITGSGTNLKLVEYAAFGVPVVTTPTGARGLAFGESSIVVADRQDFAAAVRNVLSDPSAADAAAMNARRSVEHAYDWRELSRRLDSALTVAFPG